jgi:hypothetical protein
MLEGMALKHYIGWAVPVLLLVSACNEAPKGHYPLTVQEARARLAANSFIEFRSDRQCGVLIHIVQSARSERSITWTVSSSGLSQLSFTAVLTPVDARYTKVDVTMVPELGGREPYDGTQFYPRPAVRQPVRPAIEEQVAAALETRPYDPKRLPQAKKDSVCVVQRAGLESGFRFSVNDEPGEFSR